MQIQPNLWYLYIWMVGVLIASVHAAVVADDADVDQQGLYSKSDRVQILTYRNFDKKVYHQKHALIIQFYNSYCGHCRAFAPKYKTVASRIYPWRKILQLAVIDCSVEENNEICRQFEVLAYPTLRYMHENYVKGNGNLGERMMSIETAELLKEEIVMKLQKEKSTGHLSTAPSFAIASYSTYSEAVRDSAPTDLYTFLVFENENSTVGTELALDLSDYKDINLKRVYETSELAEVAGLHTFPGLVAVRSTLEPTKLTPRVPTAQNLLLEINKFLRSKNYAFSEIESDNRGQQFDAVESDDIYNGDTVYYTDLELTLKTSLTTEITRHKLLTGEPLQALMNYLNILVNLFPAKGNIRPYLVDLRDTLSTRNSWEGSEIYEIVKAKEAQHAPVYSPNLEYKGCRGSLPQYRGYTCGLWTLFHTLTVAAVRRPSEKEGPKVLQAMHGYVKHFFGCTGCSKHFQDMAERNRLFDVKDNDKAVLWLWISHNEVNLRLAGDLTEDPRHPKIQYPSIEKCAECRLSRGAWNLPAVFAYLQTVYAPENMRDFRPARSAVAAPTPFSNLDIGMLSLLYILSFIILILVIKYFLTNRFYRKKLYKHGRGKV